MRKELLVAIVIGLTIGLIIVFGFITAQKAINEQRQAQGQPTNTTSSTTSGTVPAPSGSPTSSTKHTVTITTPKDLFVSAESEILLKGTTTPNSHVAITTEKGTFIVDATETGQFAQKIQLVGGENEIRVVSFSPELDRTETALTVVYTTAEF